MNYNYQLLRWKFFSEFFNYIKFFISFYFTSNFNYKINKIKEKEYYLNLQKKYISKGELKRN